LKEYQNKKIKYYRSKDMEKEKFWEIIEACEQLTQGDQKKYCEALKRELNHLSADEIIEFSDYFRAYELLAYRTDLWEAATVINGSCGSYGFEDFISWLISAGRSVYEDALYNPESLADVVDVGTICKFERICYVPTEVYRQKTGKQLYHGKSKDVGKYDHAKDTKNMDKNVRNLITNIYRSSGFDELSLQVNYPKLWEKFRGKTEMSWEVANILLAIDKFQKRYNDGGEIYLGLEAYDEYGRVADGCTYTSGDYSSIIRSLEYMINDLKNRPDQSCWR
jgi:hypothetical protein